MMNKTNKKALKISRRLMLIGIFSILLISLICFVIAETTPSREDLQNELNNLASELSNSVKINKKGGNWKIN